MSKRLPAKRWTWPPAPATGTDQRFHADREPRWCVSADRPRASRRGPGWRAARQWPRPRPPTPARRPASAQSDLLRRSPPHARSLGLRPRARKEVADEVHDIGTIQPRPVAGVLEVTDGSG